MKILITAATAAAAHRLKNQLNQGNIVLGDYADLPEFMFQSQNMIKLPNPKSAAYAHEMLTLCLDKEISKVYALGDDELGGLMPAEQLFSEYGIEIVKT